MTDETEQKKPKRPTKKTGGTAREWVVSTVVGMGSGLVAATAAIRSEFHDIAKNLPGIADIKGEHGKTTPGLTSKLEKELLRIDLDHYRDASRGWKEHGLDKFEAKKKHAAAVIEELENKYHIKSKGIGGLTKGTYQRYLHIGDVTKKQDIFYKGATIAIVIGVGTYNLLTSIATRKKAREIEDLILDKVLEEPAKKMEAAHRALHAAEPDTKISDVARHERLQAANAPEVAVRA